MARDLSLLILEDVQTDAELIERELRKAGMRFRSQRVESREQFVEALETFRPDIILADYFLPAFDGLSALGLTRERGLETPFIFVSGAIGEEVAIEALKRGATDYVLKNRLSRLALAVDRALREREESGRLQEAERALRESEERYRSLVELSPDGIVVHRGTEILFINSVGARMLGAEPAEVIGKNILDYLLKDYRQAVLKHIERSMQSTVVHPLEVKAFSETAESSCLEIATSPVTYADRAALQSVLRDVTERKRLEEEVIEISRREQRRIGRDLHDTLGQNLTGIGFLSKALEQRLSSSNLLEEAKEASRITNLVSQCIAQARAFARGLNPLDLSTDGLVTALEELAANTQEIFGIHCSFEQSLNRRVEETTASHLYYIATEAVNNSAKHSGAGHVCIRLDNPDGKVQLTIRDDGSGVPEHVMTGEGLGLRIQEYRARLIGATISIKRHPEGGTILRCLLDAAGPRCEEEAGHER
jgi:two-component system, NarL family, sensor histidine kinase UhpB